jgi:hypothetical protein
MSMSAALHQRRDARLTSRRGRRRLAAGLGRVLRAAEDPPAPLSSAVPVQRREVRAAHDEIEQLVEELLAPGAVQARGVLLINELLTHGDSPLFSPSAEGELDRAVRHAHAALLLK